MLKRTQFLRKAEPTARLSVPVFKKKRCGICKESFRPTRAIQPTCGFECSVKYADKVLAKSKAKLAQAERKADKAKREAMKGVPQLKKEAQEAFNLYVRLRDNGKGCFVCDKPIHMGGVGGGFDAGHIRSRSNADNLRFDERNVHGQCKPCNAPGATKDHEMKAAAVRMLGVEGAEALYNDNAPIKWLRDDLRAIRDTYRAKTKELTEMDCLNNTVRELCA